MERPAIDHRPSTRLPPGGRLGRPPIAMTRSAVVIHLGEGELPATAHGREKARPSPALETHRLVCGTANMI